MQCWKRRDFIKASALGLAATASGKLGWAAPTSAQVSLVKVNGGARDAAIRKAVELVGVPAVKGKPVVLKPNFNSADSFPGSTHPDTLTSLVRFLHELGADGVTIADRSGMGDSKKVMEDKGVYRSARELDFEPLPLDNLTQDDWVLHEPVGSHWKQGFHLARVFEDAKSIVQTCCLKTHRYGGHFTMSLKNTVGMVAKQVPQIDHDFMRELHSSPHQRRMIAEANLAYRPALVVMDAVECFVDGGPDKGKVARPDVILASADRIAIDAVGVAILREKGTNETVSKGRILDQEQIARAAEIGIGVAEADRIEIVTADGESEEYADRLNLILKA
jgi:uncharacterized protein (DUF362 family)